MSLSGKSAYETARDHGYKGTEDEWISALEKAAESGGQTITNVSFSESGDLIITLSDNTVINVGKAVGKDGKDGADGENGTDGKDGVGVSSATVNDKGQLILGFSDGTSVNLDRIVGMNGKDGKDGKDGVDGKDGINGTDGIGIASSEINSDGHLIIHYTNGQTSDLGTVIGADGKNGADGKDGTDGKDG